MSHTCLLPPEPDELVALVDFARIDAARRIDPVRRSHLGQFFTPAAVAKLMASLSALRRDRTRLLDAGAGVGMLSAAWVAQACVANERPRSIEVVAYELDSELVPSLRYVLDLCTRFAAEHGVALSYEIRNEDFIRAFSPSLSGGLFGRESFDVATLNPPYKKLRTDSEERHLLRAVGVETSNLYAAFVALALRSLSPGGELIAITPRSFCNGPYFTPFRKDLLHLASLSHLHIFDSRAAAFGDDEVLQENVIFRAERGCPQVSSVVVEWSEAGDAEHTTRREVAFSQVVRPSDADAFIHITPDEWGSQIAGFVESLSGGLPLLGVQVSTGRVVDFRVKEYLRADPSEGAVPLVYPMHFSGGQIAWPQPGSKKPNALLRIPSTESQINPSGVYVLVKRFSSKEERRRVVAAVITPEAVPGDFMAFENHLNYYHRSGQGVPRALADGLAAYLNSTLVDTYFRQFNGHTQVNATDLRKLRYPSAEQLARIATRLNGAAPTQEQLDDIVESELLNATDSAINSTAAQQQITDASAILTALGLPREQTNERAALTLLALLDLKPGEP